MLRLTRKVGEKIHIGDDIIIVVMETRRGLVRLGIDAPREINIDRGELVEPEREVRGRLMHGYESPESLVLRNRTSRFHLRAGSSQMRTCRNL